MEDYLILSLCPQDDRLIIRKGILKIGEIYRLFVFIKGNELGHKRGIRTRKLRQIRQVRILSAHMKIRIAQIFNIIQNGII